MDVQKLKLIFLVVILVNAVALLVDGQQIEYPHTLKESTFQYTTRAPGYVRMRSQQPENRLLPLIIWWIIRRPTTSQRPRPQYPSVVLN